MWFITALPHNNIASSPLRTLFSKLEQQTKSMVILYASGGLDPYARCTEVEDRGGTLARLGVRIRLDVPTMESGIFKRRRIRPLSRRRRGLWRGALSMRIPGADIRAAFNEKSLANTLRASQVSGKIASRSSLISRPSNGITTWTPRLLAFRRFPRPHQSRRHLDSYRYIAQLGEQPLRQNTRRRQDRAEKG